MKRERVMKQWFSLCIIGALLLCCRVGSAVTGQQATAVISVVRAGEPIRVVFYGTAEAEISYEIIQPGQSMENIDELPVKNIFAAVGQVKCGENGKAFAIFTPGRSMEDYAVRARNARKISWEPAVTSEHFALSWTVDDFTENNVFPSYRLTEEILSSQNTAGAAAEAKEWLDRQPEGRRAIFLAPAYHKKLFHEQADNYLWLDVQGSEMRAQLNNFFAALSRAGAKVDYFFGDCESSVTNWRLGVYNNLEVYKSIERDERYKTQIRPLLAERGFQFDTDETRDCELYYVCNWQKNRTEHVIFNRVMSDWSDAYSGKYIFAPYLTYYPDGKCSNYSDMDFDGAQQLNTSSQATYKGGNSETAGTHSSPALYGYVRSVWLPQTGFDGQTVNPSCFYALLNDQNTLRVAMLSGEKGDIAPWISRANWEGAEGYRYGNTPWYFENILHSGLLETDTFLYWGARYQSTDNINMLREQTALLSETLDELEIVAGAADKETLVTSQQSWNSHFLLTGIRSEDKNVWRITPDFEEEGITVEEFCTDSDTPTFEIAGATVTFPGCKIYNYTQSHAENGYWVVGPVTAEPVITYSPAAFENIVFSNSIAVYDKRLGILTTDAHAVNGLTVRYDYKNRTEGTKSVRLIAAGFDGTVLSFVRVLCEREIPYGHEGYLLSEMEPVPENIKLRFFLWDGSLVPLIQSVDMQ